MCQNKTKVGLKDIQNKQTLRVDRESQNKTKVGLKVRRATSSSSSINRQNKTKVGLKVDLHSKLLFQHSSQNKTKVGLKDHSYQIAESMLYMSE